MRPSERPRERCLASGAQALSLRECLALLLGSGPPGAGALGLASRVLQSSGMDLDSPEEELERAFFMLCENSAAGSAWAEIPGLGDAGRARLLAAFEIARRYRAFRSARAPEAKTRSAFDLPLTALARIDSGHRCCAHEWLGFVPEYRSGRIGSLCLVEKGVRTHVNVDPVELFARLLALRPQGFFLAHNHPSGSLNASSQDLDLTERAERLGRQFGVILRGHWIVTPESEAWIPARRTPIETPPLFQ